MLGGSEPNILLGWGQLFSEWALPTNPKVTALLGSAKAPPALMRWRRARIGSLLLVEKKMGPKKHNGGHHVGGSLLCVSGSLWDKVAASGECHSTASPEFLAQVFLLCHTQTKQASLAANLPFCKEGVKIRRTLAGMPL